MPALPDDLAAVITRISAPDADADDARDAAPASTDLTGQLAGLRTWWHELVGEAPLQVAPIPGVTVATQTAEAILLAGIAAADRAVDSGATLLVPRVDPRDARTALALIGLLTKREASAVLAQPGDMTDREWMTACASIRDLMAVHRPALGDQLTLLDGMRALPVAHMSGVLLGAAARRTPCLIDGTDEWAAALVADRLCHRARFWWRSATTSTDPARAAACERVGLEPGLRLDLDDDAGLGGAATVALLELALAR